MKHALVIDDSRQSADTLCQMLSLFEIQAQPAYGARAAIFALREWTPDIVFLDIAMPGVDGFEVLAYLRREPRLANTPVIIVTADDAPETTSRALREGALKVIIKPASLEALEDALRLADIID